MKFVFLILEYVPHQISMILEILKEPKNEVIAFAVNERFDISRYINIRFKNHLMTNLSTNEILHIALSDNPDVIVVAGWNYKKYNTVAKKIRKQKNEIPIVLMLDNQWHASIKQLINSMLGKFYFKNIFSHTWVAGIYQYEYARKLGFKKTNIIYNMYSCDNQEFNKVDISKKSSGYPKNFLYIGRFVSDKGLDYLIEKLNKFENKKGWTLTFIGNGPQKEKIKSCGNIIVKNYMNHTELLEELQLSGCFILPSTFEPWALVIHEAASAGLPIIATDVCGAAPHFLINGFNGYLVKPYKVMDLKDAMEKIIIMDEKQLIQYSYNSRKLSHCITPELCVAQLMSVVNN